MLWIASTGELIVEHPISHKYPTKKKVDPVINHQQGYRQWPSWNHQNNMSVVCQPSPKKWGSKYPQQHFFKPSHAHRHCHTTDSRCQCCGRINPWLSAAPPQLRRAWGWSQTVDMLQPRNDPKPYRCHHTGGYSIIYNIYIYDICLVSVPFLGVIRSHIISDWHVTLWNRNFAGSAIFIVQGQLSWAKPCCSTLTPFLTAWMCSWIDTWFRVWKTWCVQISKYVLSP